jgi:hypothetical protein
MSGRSTKLLCDLWILQFQTMGSASSTRVISSVEPVSSEGITASPDYLASKDPTGTYSKLNDALVSVAVAPVDTASPVPPGHVRVVCISGR